MDTPAAAFLGGFKESSFAYKCCRMCTSSGNEMKENFVASTLQLRDMHTHAQQCEIISNPNLSEQNKTYWSKQYGVNAKSILCSIEGFDVTRNIVQDPMHCLLEGTVPFVLALFLNRICFSLDIVSLSQINAEIANFPYSYLDKNRPESIDRRDVVKNAHIKQKASSMLTLCYILPFILGKVQGVDWHDQHYRNLLGLVKITCIAFSPFADKTAAGELEQLMASFLQNFVGLYPDAGLKPKMHYMLHLPAQLSQFGPLRHQSTMRCEAKHGYFKDHRWKNFVNLPYSLAEKHQVHLANAMCNAQGPSPNFVNTGEKVEEGEFVEIGDLENGHNMHSPRRAQQRK